MKKLILIVVTSAALAGCSGTPQPTVTVTIPGPTVTVTPTVKAGAPATEQETDPVIREGNRSWRLHWLKDPNRAVLFKDYPKAALLVAHALVDGKFGRVERYNEWKTELMPGQKGWGGIAANSGGDATPERPGAFAWVYYKADGSIDWSKGVHEFAIDMGPQYFGLMYSPHDMFDSRVKHSVSLDVKSNSFSPTYETCFRECDPNSESFIHTEDPTLLVQVETDAAKALDANLTELIGPGWKTNAP